jgi:molybdate transport system substrate-binding protein
VAAAANLAAAMDSLVAAFTAEHHVPVRVSLGATGQLYAQIVNGAPYHVLLAADRERARLLEEAGAAMPGTRFTYGLGRLVLFAPSWAPLPEEPWPLLARPGIRVAVANPRTAPYGEAARDVLERLELTRAVAPALVTGEGVGQAYQFVRSGAAEAGLVALAQVVRDEPPERWRRVPDELHAGVAQDAVLLAAGRDHAGARAFLDFLGGPRGRAILERFGYDAAPPGGAR